MYPTAVLRASEGFVAFLVVKHSRSHPPTGKILDYLPKASPI